MPLKKNNTMCREEEKEQNKEADPPQQIPWLNPNPNDPWF
jgi:hypothetical protein